MSKEWHTLLSPLQGEGWGGDGVNGIGHCCVPHPPPNLPLEGGGAGLLMLVSVVVKTRRLVDAYPDFQSVIQTHRL